MRLRARGAEAGSGSPDGGLFTAGTWQLTLKAAALLLYGLPADAATLPCPALPAWPLLAFLPPRWACG